jgi:hypothetical protein
VTGAGQREKFGDAHRKYRGRDPMLAMSFDRCVSMAASTASPNFNGRDPSFNNLVGGGEERRR